MHALVLQVDSRDVATGVPNQGKVSTLTHRNRTSHVTAGFNPTQLELHMT